MQPETKQDREINKYFRRVKELEVEGLEWIHASGIAQLESQIKHWPEEWGDDFVVLIWGDFEPLDTALNIDHLGITIHPEPLSKTVIKGVRTVHRANVKVSEKSIKSIIDASKRINVFLGIFSLVTWTNCSCGWWSFITHGSRGGGILTRLSHKDLEMAIDGVMKLNPEIRRKFDAALYWLREPKNSMLDSYRPDILRIYAAYWNAFECLVDAMCIIKPRDKSNKKQKQQDIEDIFERHNKILSGVK